MTSSQLVAGEGTTATTTVNFSAQAAGTLLVLSVASDAYRNTAGANRPEGNGWTVTQSVGGDGQFHGSYMWHKIATGSETSVAYTLTGAARSAYVLTAHTDIDTTTPLDVSAQQQVNGSGASYTTPTSPTTSAGDKLGIAHMTASWGSGVFTGMSTWLNSYTQVAVGLTTLAPGLVVGHGVLAFTGGGTTSSGATFVGSGSAQARAGFIAVFNVAGAGPAPISGTLSASAPALTVGVTTAAISGTVAVPIYTGTPTASTPTLTAGPPIAAISGTTAVPVYSGTPTASLPALTAGPTTAAITGTTTAPSGDGTLSAALPEVTVGPATLAASGTVTVPTYPGDLAASTAALGVGPTTVAWTGTSTPPAFTGTLGANLPGLEVGPATAAISGTISAPGTSTLAADLPTIVIGPPTTSISGTVAVPTWTATLDATLPAVSIGPPVLALAGTTSAPTATGALAATLPTITVGPMTAVILDSSIPPLPTDGVSLTVSTGTRGLTLTAEARSLEVST